MKGQGVTRAQKLLMLTRRAAGVPVIEIAAELGMSRRTVYRHLADPVRPVWSPAPCGTERAWQAHYRAGEVACFECRVAHAAYNRERRRAVRDTHT